MRRIEAAFLAACQDELDVPKPGNVHVHADGHGMSVADFQRSAAAAAPQMCQPGASLGARVLGAVTATRAAVGQNTNLGIVLLCAPLAMAAERPGTLAAAVTAVLTAADMDDARAVFQAIALANPGGLGEAPLHDVRRPPEVSLAVAMGEAAGRDLIARQWTTGYADILGGGLDACAGDERTRATLAVFLHFLAAFPDSHILRKHGPAIAERVRREAAVMRGRLHANAGWSALLPDLLSWDADLKAAGINPGTSADMTVAAVFAYRLQNGLRRLADHG